MNKAVIKILGKDAVYIKAGKTVAYYRHKYRVPRYLAEINGVPVKGGNKKVKAHDFLCLHPQVNGL